MRLHKVLLSLTFVFLLTVPAHSGVIQKVTSGDPGVTDWHVDGWTELGFVAQGRIGNNAASGNYELNVGKNTDVSADFNQADYVWGQGASQAFSLVFDGSEAIFDVGGTSVSWDSFALAQPFNGLMLRTSAQPGQTVSFTGLTLNSDPLGDSTTATPETASSRTVDWLLMSGFGDLSSGFTLSGNVAFDWTTTTNLSGSNLAFQIKAANAVPIPAAVWLLGSGLLGLIGVRRFRKS